MSKFPGGIFSKARGKVSGIVFSSARTRQGKLMTARELVIPANPKTDQQQANRSMFKSIQEMVRSVGPSVYRTHWNRGVEDLPGYQSLLSLVRRSYDLTDVFEGDFIAEARNTNPQTLLGDLFSPSIIQCLESSSTSIEVTWDTWGGLNGDASDTVNILLFNGRVDGDQAGWWTVVNDSAVRGDGFVVVNHPAQSVSGITLAVVYFTNFNNPSGEQRSSASWFILNSY